MHKHTDVYQRVIGCAAWAYILILSLQLVKVQAHALVMYAFVPYSGMIHNATILADKHTVYDSGLIPRLTANNET